MFSKNGRKVCSKNYVDEIDGGRRGKNNYRPSSLWTVALKTREDRIKRKLVTTVKLRMEPIIFDKLSTWVTNRPWKSRPGFRKTSLENVQTSKHNDSWNHNGRLDDYSPRSPWREILPCPIVIRLGSMTFQQKVRGMLHVTSSKN
jgi:hypothetical protein